jgi:hypothetical protein
MAVAYLRDRRVRTARRKLTLALVVLIAILIATAVLWALSTPDLSFGG